MLYHGLGMRIHGRKDLWLINGGKKTLPTRSKENYYS